MASSNRNWYWPSLQELAVKREGHAKYRMSPWSHNNKSYEEMEGNENTQWGCGPSESLGGFPEEETLGLSPEGDEEL